jgi:hypothetical protein
MRNNKVSKQQQTSVSYLKTLAEQARELRVRYQKPGTEK